MGEARGSHSVLWSGGSVKAMREIAQAIFAMSSNNSEETALALIAAVEQYVNDEEDVKEHFSDIVKEMEEPIPSISNPLAPLLSAAETFRPIVTERTAGVSIYAPEQLKGDMDTEEIKRLVFYISAGVSASAFTKVAKGVEEQLTGSSLLTFASLQFIARGKNINSGSDVNDIPDSIRASLNPIEESFQSGDEDIHNELEKILSSWSLKELVFPDPAGLSNISSNDFRHESEL